jgi:nitrogen regulatory protein PII
VKAIFLVLNKIEKLDDVLKTFLDCGVKGATILNSTGMGGMLAGEVPLFASLGLALHEDRPYSYTIFAVMDKSKVDSVIDAIDDCLDGLDKPDTGILMVLPVERAAGLPRKNK